MKNNRPVNLDIATIRLPITAYVSILHRVSGVVMLAGVLVLMWMLDASLSSPESFAVMVDMLQAPLARFVLWLVLAALAYHFSAGIRHLIMDMGIGESLQGGKRGAAISLFFSLVLIVLAGVWVW